jgi:iron complex transport system ATP-binding protein
MLETRSLSFAYQQRRVLEDINLKLSPGVAAVIGPNAAGKSTLLKCLAGLLHPQGKVLLDDLELSAFNPRTLSQRISYLPQEMTAAAVITVYETVLLGRMHQLSWRVSRADRQITGRLLDNMGLTSLAESNIQELSGGQRQMVFIAQALAREPAILLMDEPTSSLDLHHQFEICEWIQRWTSARNMTTVMAVHDLNIAARFADIVYVLNDGRIVAQGTPESVITSRMISQVYRVEADVWPDKRGKPSVCPLNSLPEGGG